MTAPAARISRIIAKDIFLTVSFFLMNLVKVIRSIPSIAMTAVGIMGSRKPQIKANIHWSTFIGCASPKPVTTAITTANCIRFSPMKTAKNLESTSSSAFRGKGSR